MSKLARYMHDKGAKTETHVTSVNITKEQHEFLEKHDLNLSKIVRDAIEALIKEVSE
jgi:post-segregation antitoxin (ccd killing protein)